MEYAGEAAMDVGLRERTAGGARLSERAFEAIFLEYYARLVGILHRMVGDRGQAEEVVSEAFLKLYQTSPADGWRNPGGWLYRTATRLAIDSLRAFNRRIRSLPEAAEAVAVAQTADPLDDALRRERARQVRAVLARLKPVQAQILSLRASGLSYKELAEALRVKPASVGRLLARSEAAFEKTYRRLEAASWRGSVSKEN